MDKKKNNIHVANDLLEIDNQTYFTIFEVKNPKNKDETKNYVVAYEDLELLQETLTYKNPNHNLMLPNEEDIIEDQDVK